MDCYLWYVYLSLRELLHKAPAFKGREKGGHGDAKKLLDFER